MSPTEFSRIASQVPLEDAVRALREAGVSVPRNVRIEDITQVLQEVPKLTSEQIRMFLQKVER